MEFCANFISTSVAVEEVKRRVLLVSRLNSFYVILFDSPLIVKGEEGISCSE